MHTFDGGYFAINDASNSTKWTGTHCKSKERLLSLTRLIQDQILQTKKWCHHVPLLPHALPSSRTGFLLEFANVIQNAFHATLIGLQFLINIALNQVTRCNIGLDKCALTQGWHVFHLCYFLGTVMRRLDVDTASVRSEEGLKKDVLVESTIWWWASTISLRYGVELFWFVCLPIKLKRWICSSPQGKGGGPICL